MGGFAGLGLLKSDALFENYEMRTVIWRYHRRCSNHTLGLGYERSWPVMLAAILAYDD